MLLDIFIYFILVSILAATVGSGTPADRRMVIYVWRKPYQVMFLTEWITTFLTWLFASSLQLASLASNNRSAIELDFMHFNSGVLIEAILFFFALLYLFLKSHRHSNIEFLAFGVLKFWISNQSINECKQSLTKALNNVE